MTKFVPIAAACLVAALPAYSQSVAQPVAPAPTPSLAPIKPKLICETQTETGSRLDRKRVCHTAAEWQQIKSESRDAIDKYQQQATGTPVSR